jgi:hypothetical protein
MQYLLVLFLLFPFVCFSKGEHHTQHRIRVGTNLEEELGFSGTMELNIYRSSLYSNYFIEYKNENDFEAGLYFNNIPLVENYYGYSPTYVYDSYIGISKYFSITKDLKVGFGTQSGTQLRSGVSNFLNFDYAGFEYELTDRITIGAGPYFANASLSTVGNKIGASVDVSIKLIKSVLWIESSWYSGSTNISGSVVNLVWKPIKSLGIYCGTQVPATNSGNEFAGNIGFIYQLH